MARQRSHLTRMHISPSTCWNSAGKEGDSNGDGFDVEKHIKFGTESRCCCAVYSKLSCREKFVSFIHKRPHMSLGHLTILINLQEVLSVSKKKMILQNPSGFF